jgi:hypothetical protein
MINASLRDEVTGGLARRKGLKVSDDGCSNTAAAEGWGGTGGA